MKMKRLSKATTLFITITSAAAQIALAPNGSAAGFTIGDLVVEQLAQNTTSSTFEIIELNPYASNAAPVISVGIPSTGSGALRQSSSASTGRLALTRDRTLLAFTGAKDATGVTDGTTVLPRGVGTVDVNTNYTLQASYTGVSGDQSRSATSLNNITWYFGDKAGIYTNNVVTTPLNSANVRPLKS